MNLDMLNEQQREAVLTTEGPLLILAGAGSGKTRVLTYRTAYLIDECGVNPYNIMAITFTNKAAGEMRERIDDMVGYGSESIWVSTFHSTCVRILRRYIDRLGYDTNFTIYDADDQKALMKDICKRLEIDTKMYKEKMFLNVISSAKDEMIDPIEFENRFTGDFVKRKQALVYKEYQNALKQNNALDFDDLLVKTVELFKLDKEVLDYYQERFRYIMVDEYQDTNTVQFELIRLLAMKYKNLCVVGDDDQSIYKFRGANIYNILNFEKHFEDAKVIKLEQNYRSTQNILDAANSVISNNVGRKDKRLWTDNGAGDRITFEQLESGFEEADYVARSIARLVRKGEARYKDCAVLYRTNAQSRLFEEKFIAANIPYKIVGGVNFYARKEIKDILAYMDRNFDPVLDSKIKMLYIEQIKQPDKLLYHASSLIRKGCKIAAIKAGSTESGKRAASSHTGAIASSDSAVEALFRKAGIVRCFSREELTTVASIFTLKDVKGKNCAIVTHAGGPAVMLADALSKGRLNVPSLEGPIADELKSKLYPGAAVGNPIDIIGTGTPEHLATAIDFCENRFDNVDLMMVIFGSPGLVKLYDTYEVLHKKMEECKKPIFPILPSIVTAGPEVKSFVKKGHVNFSDEVTLGTALSRVINTPKPMSTDIQLYGVDVPEVRRIIDRLPGSGYLNPEEVRTLLRAANIPLVEEYASDDRDALLAFAKKVKYPVVAKVVGPVHKSDIGGVALNIRGEEHLLFEYERMMRLPGVTGIMVQPMLKGQELFLGAKYEDRFGHVVLCGLGGIFVEVLKDVSYGLAPLSYDETYSMIRSLRGYPIIKGTRGQKGIDEQQYADIIVRLSTLLRFASEIKEMDINPLVATDRGLFAVDARIRIEK